MKKVFFITDSVVLKKNAKPVKRFEFAHVYNKHIIASTRQGYSRLAGAENSYDKNFKAGAKREYVTRAEYNKIMKIKG